MNTELHNPWSDTPEALAEALQSNLATGITEKESKLRLATSGENVFESQHKQSGLTIFLRQFTSPLIIMLCIAVVITAFLHEWLDTTIIGFAVLVNTLLGFVQEYKAEQAIDDLRSYITHRTRVIRNGKEIEIDPRLIVVGDILHIGRGARITADARIIKEINFTADESILTGESLPVEKTVEPLVETAPLPERTNMIFAGTLGVDGSAYAIVTATGYHTEIGKLALLVDQTSREQTPLQRALSKLTWVIIIATTIAVIGLFVAGLSQGQSVYDMLLISIAVLVGSVPEALPIGLTAILAIGVQRIAKKKGIMRSLTAAETLGSTTLIITDKTGTLTQADMQLINIDTAAQLSVNNFTLHDHHEHFSVEERELLTLAVAASDVTIENPEEPPEKWVMNGSGLETNIITAAAAYNITQFALDRSTIQVRIPFSSRYKYSVVRIPEKYLPKQINQFVDPHIVMGAPDIILDKSNLDGDEEANIHNAIDTHSRHGRRVLGLGVFTPKKKENSLSPSDVLDVTFLGVLSFHDPIRPEVPAALAHIKSYGTKVIMATGDLPGTAISVATKLGWEVDDTNILTGSQIQQLSDEDLTVILDRIRIFARVTPKDKLRITRLHQAQGEIVAMTGDGVNDAPSLKAANIGIAVGSGSDVAKSVADLILLDDNFKTIVATIEEGKQILANIKKMFVYLMSNALDELFLIGGAILTNVALPLTAAQIIWVNLFTGSLPAIAFAFDRQRMQETEKTNRRFFDPRVLFLTIFIGITVSLLLFGLYYTLLQINVPIPLARSILFASFGSYTLFIAFSFLDLSQPLFKYKITANTLLLAGIGAGVMLMILTFTVPFLQQTFSVMPLPPIWILFVLLWSIMNILLIEATKWFANRYIVRTNAKQAQ